MQKFTCGHCGGRLAISPKHLGQLVICPECRKPTHPLAGEILSASKDGGPASRAPSADPIERKCENCGRLIGRLETPQLWDKHVVCADCLPKLEIASGKPEPAKPAKRKKAAKAEPEELTVSASEATAAPTVTRAEKGVAALPDDRAPIAASDAPTIVFDNAAAIVKAARATTQIAKAAKAVTTAITPVEVRRVDSNDRGDPRRTAGPSLTARHRLITLAIAVFVGGCALYGMLTLLQNVMGYLLTLALVLVAAAVGLTAARICWVGFKRWRNRGKEGTDIETMRGD